MVQPSTLRLGPPEPCLACCNQIGVQAPTCGDLPGYPASGLSGGNLLNFDSHGLKLIYRELDVRSYNQVCP